MSKNYHRNRIKSNNSVNRNNVNKPDIMKENVKNLSISLIATIITAFISLFSINIILCILIFSISAFLLQIIISFILWAKKYKNNRVLTIVRKYLNYFSIMLIIILLLSFIFNLKYSTLAFKKLGYLIYTVDMEKESEAVYNNKLSLRSEDRYFIKYKKLYNLTLDVYGKYSKQHADICSILSYLYYIKYENLINDYAVEAIDIYESINKNFDYVTENAGITYKIMGDYYHNSCDFYKALEMNRKALSSIIKSKKGYEHKNINYIISNLIDEYIILGDYYRAQIYSDLMLGITYYKKFKNEKNGKIYFNCFSNKMYILTNLGERKLPEWVPAEEILKNLDFLREKELNPSDYNLFGLYKYYKIKKLYNFNEDECEKLEEIIIHNLEKKPESTNSLIVYSMLSKDLKSLCKNEDIYKNITKEYKDKFQSILHSSDFSENKHLKFLILRELGRIYFTENIDIELGIDYIEQSLEIYKNKFLANINFLSTHDYINTLELLCNIYETKDSIKFETYNKELNIAKKRFNLNSSDLPITKDMVYSTMAPFKPILDKLNYEKFLELKHELESTNINLDKLETYIYNNQ